MLLPKTSNEKQFSQQVTAVLAAQSQLITFEEPPEESVPVGVVNLKPEDELEAGTGELEANIDMNALFSEGTVLDDADSFWDEASDIAESESGTGKSGFLNFEQAQQLGLVPDEEV